MGKLLNCKKITCILSSQRIKQIFLDLQDNSVLVRFLQDCSGGSSSVSMPPRKKIDVFSDIILISLGLADHQIDNIKHEMNKMTPDEEMKEPVFLIELCP